MKKDVVFKGKFNLYFTWPAILGGLWAAAVIVLLVIDPKAGGIAALFLAVYAVAAFFLYRNVRRSVAAEMMNFAVTYDRMEKDLLADFALPAALLDMSGAVLWVNEAFSAQISSDNVIGKNISWIIPELVRSELPRKENKTELEFVYNGKHYRAAMQKADEKQLAEGQKLLEVSEGDYIIALYLFDESELHRQYQINEDNKIVVGIISIDNYDEALESVEEVRRSLLLALIDRRVNKYFSEFDGVLRKVDKEHYFFIVRKTKYNEMKDGKFKLLEDVKDVRIGNEMSVTLSMGLGLNQGSFTKDTEAAQAAIDMALARGGDQVIIRDNEKVTFFGGRTGAVEKYTRVKARVKAHALREIIGSKERVVIMGHKITDVDALGAALGIYRAAKTLEKPAYIVIDRSSRSIQPLIAEIGAKSEYDDLLVDRNRAKELVDDDTVLVIVDTNRPSYTECRELLDKTEAIVVLDHHRQGEEVIKNARLSYIEPYASSACEMASEILQYFDEEVKLKSIEADCMYAGIMIDTNNFNMRTGVRTFEAAAYLRRNGADMTRVRKMFREDQQDYLARAKAISEAELYMDAFAISICPSEGLSSPTIICAQAANELLNIIGVKASFVLTEYNNLVYVSARAIDEVNVQLIMERLGGGGHINMAGTQFEGLTLMEVKALIEKTIREMAEEGDI